mmetsp:Transcript_8434/g.12432  ORF Transcript_8434/g.12432 Transcript_8434/m.12432 type:complete len:111 (+) Transcript_8434:240-572(+)
MICIVKTQRKIPSLCCWRRGFRSAEALMEDPSYIGKPKLQATVVTTLVFDLSGLIRWLQIKICGNHDAHRLQGRNVSPPPTPNLRVKIYFRLDVHVQPMSRFERSGQFRL